MKQAQILTAIFICFSFTVVGQKAKQNLKTKSTNNIIGYWIRESNSKIGKEKFTFLFRPDFTGVETDDLEIAQSVSPENCQANLAMKVNFTYKIEKDKVIITYQKSDTQMFVQSYPLNSEDKIDCEDWRKQKEISQQNIFSKKDYNSYSVKYLYLKNSLEILGEMYQRK